MTTRPLTIRCSEIREGVIALLVLHDASHHAAVVDEWGHTETLYQHVLKVVRIELEAKQENWEVLFLLVFVSFFSLCFFFFFFFLGGGGGEIRLWGGGN